MNILHIFIVFDNFEGAAKLVFADKYESLPIGSPVQILGLEFLCRRNFLDLPSQLKNEGH